MTIDVAELAVTTRYRDNAPAALVAATHWPNQRMGAAAGEFDPPSPIYDPAAADPPIWARFAHGGASAERIGIAGDPGDPPTRNTATTTIQLFTPEGAGEGYIVEQARLVRDVFRTGAKADGILYRNTQIIRVGLDPAGAWYRVNVVVTWEYDEGC